MDDLSSTNFTLLARIRRSQHDQRAWSEFVDRYGRLIYLWCLQRRLQPADAEDVTQSVLVKLAKRLETFEYDRQLTFRGWLRRVTENALSDFFQARRQQPIGAGGSGVWERLNEEQARDDLTSRICDAFDLELLEKAMASVRTRVNSHRWQAWQLTACQGRSGAEVAHQLNMKVASVYTARKQIQDMIRAELEILQRDIVH